METDTKPGKTSFNYWLGYILAIGLVALATWLKYLAQPGFIPANVPILYFLAIVPTAVFFGFGLSILVCLLSVLAFDFFFTPPLYHIDLYDVRNVTFLGLFFMVGLAISYLASNLRTKNQIAVKEISARKQSESELARHRDHLEDLVKQRTNELEKANLVLKQDIAAREKAEQALRESEQRWATTLASVGDGVIATDVAGKITFMNSVAEALTGWSLFEAVTRPIAEVFNIVNEQTRQKVDNPAVKVIQKGIVVGLANHTILIQKGGKEFAIGDSGAPIKTEAGQITGVVLVFRDVSEQKQAEAALEASEVSYRRLFETSKDGILILEFASGRITSVNPFLKDLLGYGQSEMLGKQLWEIGAFRDILASKDAFLELQTKGYIRYEDLPLETKDGRRIKVEFVSNVYPVDHTQVIQCNIRDITDRKKAEEALKKYTAALEMANQELESFSYSVSHDLRAPLRTLDGFSEMVLEDYKDKLDENGRDYLNRIRKAGQTMSQLIDDMLKLSRITRSEMLKNEVNLSDLAQSIFAELKAAQPERQAEFIVAPGTLVSGDKQLLQILMRNLLENAWKFTGKCARTRVEFGVTRKDGDTVYFINDNGAGFDMQYSDKLFQPFQRLHTDTEYTGTGIGLAIVQRVIQRHGGRIWAESEIGKGTAFYFTLDQI